MGGKNGMCLYQNLGISLERVFRASNECKSTEFGKQKQINCFSNYLSMISGKE